MKEKAKSILLNNNFGGYTIPSPKLYPFQWNWDSGFIALGLSHFDKQKSFREIQNMFKGQWSNGMLPHIVFHKLDDNYFPGPDVWGTSQSKWAPRGLATSGITQPPVFGFILSMMATQLAGKDPQFDQLLREIFPKIVDFHRYLYSNRDPGNDGLVYINHNWESGTDNSPLWDHVLDSIDTRHVRDVSSLRRDLKNVHASQRPTNENYKRYIYLVDLMRECNYDDRSIYEKTPFAIQDVLFNSLLIRSNEGLIQLAGILGEDDSEIKGWNQKTITALNQKCWNQQYGFYYDYDLKTKAQIPIKASNGLMPLFAGACNLQQAEILKMRLMESFKNGNYWLCTSCAVDEPSFNPVKYWRGPVWINVNWMLYHGLMRYQFTNEAKLVKQHTIRLIEKCGFYEYFDPRYETEDRERGLGGQDFSWTAALYLDLVNDE